MPPDPRRAEQRTRRVNAFREEFRRPIADFTLSEPRLEDLADSFPALLFALATRYGSLQRRTAAVALVLRGSSLKNAAGALGMPMWMRRLDPGALTRPLLPVPTDAELDRSLGGCMPVKPAAQATWLDCVLIGHAMAGAEGAVWMATLGHQIVMGLSGTHILPWLAAWLWASRSPDAEISGLVLRHWTPDVGMETTFSALQDWERRIKLTRSIAEPIRDVWLSERACGDYEVKALRTPQDFMRAASDLNNCLESWGGPVCCGEARIFTLRRGDLAVAAFEIVPDPEDPPMPRLRQVLGYLNRPVPLELWQKLSTWIETQRFRPIDTSPIAPEVQDARQMELWGPFLGAFARVPGSKEGLLPRFHSVLLSEAPTTRRQRHTENERRQLANLPVRNAPAEVLRRRIARR